MRQGARQVQLPIDERLAQLVSLLRQGHTAAQIAARIGIKKGRVKVLLDAGRAKGLIVSERVDGELRHRAANRG